MRTRSIAFLTIALALVLATTFITLADQPFSYMYKRGEESYLRISGDFDQIERHADRWGDEFVWFSRDGREYVITDAATLATIRTAFRDVEARQPAVRALEQRMRPIEDEIERAEKRVDTMSDRLGDEEMEHAQRSALEQKLEVAERELEAAERRLRPLEQELDKLENELDRLEDVAERKLVEIMGQAVRNGTARRAD